MAKAHAFTSDYHLWVTVIGDRRERVALQAAGREYEFGLMALAFGSYRSAFGSLRLFLELALASIRWSVNEQELREWLRGERDVNWAALIDAERGVMAKAIVRLFSDVFDSEVAAYRASAAAVYRECSEFIHGNALKNSALPDVLEFNQTTFDIWHQKASVTRLVVTFALASRYLAELPKPARNQLEHALTDALGHSPGVRQLLGTPHEVEGG